MSEKSRAVFLDRDGTIIEDAGYINSPQQIKFIPGSIDAIKLLNQAGYKVIVITNQSGIARGLLTENMLQTIDKLIRRQVLSGGGHIDGLYYCPHHPVHGHYPYRQNCECRKPHTGLINKATQENNLDLAHSFMIGDKTTDIETGKRSGLRTVMVETGYGAKEKIQLKDAPNHIAKDLRAAVDWVLSQ